jgi:hypothetical protein
METVWIPRSRGSDNSKIENQIGCGYCCHEHSCKIKTRDTNKALSGCPGFKHHTKTK